MDDFSDDGFDELEDTALQELENNAIQCTQAQKLGQTQHGWEDSEDYGLEDDDLDDAVVIDAAAQAPVRRPVDIPVQLQPQTPSHVQDGRPLPSRSIAQPRWQQPETGAKPPIQYQASRPPPAASGHDASRPSVPHRMGPPGPSSSNRYGTSAAATTAYMRPLQPPTSSFRHGYQQSQDLTYKPPQTTQNEQKELEALQARVRALENDLNSARGEAAIVRSKYGKTLAAHEAEVSRLKKQNAEALSKQERLVEAAIHAEKAASTELQFTRQDLRDELSRSKKQRTDSVEVGTSTPRKNKANVSKSFADGFDDVEVLPSPSRAQGAAKSKNKNPTLAPGEKTPSRGKRKRPAVDSPVTALEVEDDVLMADAEPVSRPERTEPIPRPRALPYDLLRLVLDHGAIHGQPLTFDLLARYSFPSDPEQSFAGIIFQRLPSLGDPHDPMRLLIDFCELIIDLWDQCLRERCYEPIYDLASLVTLILQLNSISVAPYIISTLIPVAHTTILLLAAPRFESQDGELSTRPDETIRHLTLNIDTEGTLQLMHLAALACSDSYLLDPANPLNLGPAGDSPQRLYWKLMQIEFVLCMISHKQPREEYLGMLALLCTSSLPDTIGPITGEADRDPAFVAQALIERVSKIMYEPTRWSKPGDTSASFGHRHCVTRLAALRTLMAFAQSSLGATQLALSDVAIPRLVNVLCGAIDALYDMDVHLDFLGISSDEKTTAGALQSESSRAETNEMAQGILSKNAADVGDDQDASLEQLATNGTIEANPTNLLYTLVSSIILLLHTLVTDPLTSAHTDMRAKLSTSHGASQKYLLTLSRLNYAEEDLVLEAGIDPGTFDRANDLLDLAITPDEAEGVREVFGGWT